MHEARIIRAAETLAQTFDLGEGEQVSALQGEGFAEGEAWRIVTLLPLAFSRPVLEQLGVRRFVMRVTARQADGRRVTAMLTRQPEYVAGLKLARKHRQNGVMEHSVYVRIAESSADINAASKALNEGADIAGATVAASLVGPEIAKHLIR
ncbi:hypothetical protein DBR21_18670 [Caulobacter sp. HMWF009]|nr:hypothetical protein DBR21_18670 [Caulobacter sp. HMWF009]PTT08934.1 hypothetical protein DBR10_08065 [Caulobacter sp. HMWF025]